MKPGILKEMIAVIRAEQQRRASLLTEENSNFAYDQWLFTDEPFVNELCLMLLVTLRHQVERELVSLGARSGGEEAEINGQQYQEKVEQLRKGKGWDWKEIEDRLELKFCEGYEAMEALRFLANSYKHDPSMEPSEELMQLLNLVSRQHDNVGYRRFSLILASSLVKRQSILACAMFRLCCHAATSDAKVALSGIRRSRHWRVKTLSSISAILSQLPCFGV